MILERSDHKMLLHLFNLYSAIKHAYLLYEEGHTHQQYLPCNDIDHQLQAEDLLRQLPSIVAVVAFWQERIYPNRAQEPAHIPGHNLHMNSQCSQEGIRNAQLQVLGHLECPSPRQFQGSPLPDYK